MSDSPERIWIAEAPWGRPTTGPVVIEGEESLQEWREMGWNVMGPYDLVSDKDAAYWERHRISSEQWRGAGHGGEG